MMTCYVFKFLFKQSNSKLIDFLAGFFDQFTVLRSD